MICMADTDTLSFDLDDDGIADVKVEKTNGHTVYVNLRWVYKVCGTVVAAILSVVGAWIALG